MPRFKTKTVSVLMVLLVFLCCMPIPDSPAALKDKVFEAMLPNGLKVIMLENDKSPTVTFQVWYHVGSRNEEWGKTGLSHMLEHMMFKGTNTISAQEFSRIIQDNGGDFNAFTSRDFTAYFENLSADRIQTAIDLESDRMHNLVLREEDFRTERLVVMEERRLRTEDEPKVLLLDQLEATAFQLQPYHWPTVGWMEDIARFTLEDLKHYYGTYYSPVNAFVVVVGDFKKEQLVPMIAKAFGEIPRGIPPDEERALDPPQKGERRIFLKQEAELPFLIMGFHVPNLREQDSYALEVIATLLSGGKSSRLYRHLVLEKQLALNAEASQALLSRDPELFLISAEVLPGREVAEVEKALDEELVRLQKESVGEDELQKAKNQLEASFVYGQDSLFGQALLLAHYEIAVGWGAIDDYLPSIKRVTAEDIRRVVSRYLIPDNRTVGILTPLAPKAKKSAASEFSIKTKTVR